MKLVRFKARLGFAAIPILGVLLPKADRLIAHSEEHTEQELYDYAFHLVNFLRKLFSTKTIYTGLENLPKDCGYVMYSNHQGKYDALGIILAHKKPISILWDIRSAKQPLTKQVSKLLKCEVIDTSQKQNFIPSMQHVAEVAKSGKPYLVFPEGGYTDNKNNLQDFQTGCFMISTLAHTPVVPVVLYDSYKSMDGNKIFGRVTTQVHFLKPIMYEEYQSMNRKSLCALVKERIQEKLDELNGVEHKEEKTIDQE